MCAPVQKYCVLIGRHRGWHIVLWKEDKKQLEEAVVWLSYHLYEFAYYFAYDCKNPPPIFIHPFNQ